MYSVRELYVFMSQLSSHIIGQSYNTIAFLSYMYAASARLIFVILRGYDLECSVIEQHTCIEQRNAQFIEFSLPE